MTTLRTAAQQALEALEMSRRFVYADNRPQCDEAIAALRAALAQQDEPVQEPAYKVEIAGRWHDAEPLLLAFSLPDGEHLLYTAPPQRKPLSLTDLQEALVLTNLIDRDAIEDPEEYDEGSTLAQIDELYRIIIKERA